MHAIGLSILLAFTLALAATPQTVRPRTHFDPTWEQSKRLARLSLPSRNASVVAPRIHSLSRISARELQPNTPKQGARAIGRHRSVDRDALRKGAWSTLPDGTQLWRLAIQSPSALGIRLHFTSFSIGAGQLWIHNGTGDDAQIAGPYSGAGPHGDGDFWSETIASDTTTIEFQTAAGQPETLPFQIEEISHVYDDPDLKAELHRAAAATCNLDVTCFAEWAETAKAVARISFESGGGSFVCSGTLLNTRNGSGVPLFLTANHCIDTDAVARTFQALWSFQTASCNGTPPSTRDVQRTSGARLLVTGDRSQGDFTLLRLDSVPSGVVFSGWDPQEVPEGTALTVVHHPSGDYKRIAFGNRVANSRTPNNYYSVFYSQGLTEGGSSGSGLFSAPLVLSGTLSNGPKADTPEEYCRIIPFADNYGRFSSFFPLLRDILEDRTVTAPPPATSSRDLTSGVPATVTLPAVANASLFSGNSGYRITVPQGATRLDIVLRTSTPNVDVDLFARFNTDLAVTGGTITADHKSEGPDGNEQITITATSTPALRAGTYFIGFGLFTNGVAVNATLTATVTTATAPPPTTTPTVLTSGTARPFTISPVPSGTLIAGGFTIAVPQGATRLDIRLSSTTANADLDLYARFNTEPIVANGSVTADHRSEGDTADELITITPSSSPALRAGTYFIRVASFTANVTINASITATVTTTTTPPPSGATVLTSGRAQNFTIPAVTGNTLINGARGYSIVVPQGATRLNIVLTTATPNVDLDLYARVNSDVGITGGNVLADHRSEGATGSEQLSITPASSPGLQPGTYFIALGVFTPGVAINGTLTATVTTATTPPPATGPVVLTSGVRQPFTLPSTAQAVLHNGARSFVIDVPANATRFDVQLTTSTAGADLDLFVRAGSDTAVTSGGEVTADYSSTGPDGSERITITPTSTPPLRAGRYFLSLAAFTTNTEISGSLLVTVSTPATVAPPPSAPTVLTSGAPAKFSLPAVDAPTLYNGNFSYKITVPEGATSLRLQLVSDNPSVDVDLYSRFESDTDLGDGVLADYFSEGPNGNESITIDSASSPPLRPGTYFISLALFTRGAPSTGTLTATVVRGSLPPATSSARELTSGTAVNYTLPSVTTGTLFTGSASYRITVGAQHTRLAVSVRNDPSDIDVDLFGRFGQEPAVIDGRIVADARSVTDFGNEDIVISGANLRPGVYFFSLGLFTNGREARGTITATLSSDGGVTEPAEITLVTSASPLAAKHVQSVATLAAKDSDAKRGFAPAQPVTKASREFKKRILVGENIQ